MAAAERLALAFMADHPDEAARLLERAAPTDAARVLAAASPPVSTAVYGALGPSPAAACASALDDDTLAALVGALPIDAGAATLRSLDATRRAAVQGRLEDELSDRLDAVLAYPANSAGSFADPRALALAADATVADARRQLSGSERHVFYYLYVVDRHRTLLGTLALPELMEASARRPLAEVMRRDLVKLDAHTELATVAVHPAWRELDALPVVDGAGRLIGAIRHQAIRQMSWDPARPMMETLVGLSELYWAGLSGLLASLAPAPTPGVEEGSNVP